MILQHQRPASDASHSHRSSFCYRFHSAGITACGSDRLTPVRYSRGEVHPRSPALGGKLFAIDRSDMRRVSIEVRAPDPKFSLARIDPLPQLYGRGEARQTGFALDAHEIGRKPVAVAAT